MCTCVLVITAVCVGVGVYMCIGVYSLMCRCVHVYWRVQLCALVCVDVCIVVYMCV